MKPGERPLVVGLVPADDLADATILLAKRLLAEIADLLAGVHGGNDPAWQQIRDRLTALQKLQRDTAVAGYIMGILSPWTPRVRPVPVGERPPASRLPWQTVATLAASDRPCCQEPAGRWIDLAASDNMRGFWYGFWPVDPNAIAPPYDRRSAQGIVVRSIDASEAKTLATLYSDWAFSTDAGKRRAWQAWESVKDDETVLTAYDPKAGVPVGSISYYPSLDTMAAEAGSLVISNIGTDGTVKGTGVRLMDEVLNRAKTQGKGIAADISASEASADFFTKWGMRRTTFGMMEVAPESVPGLVLKKVAEKRVTRVFTALEESADWLAERGLTSMHDFERVADQYKADPAWKTDDVLAELNQHVGESLRAGEDLPAFRDRIASVLQAPRASVETLYRTQTKRAYDAGQDRIVNNPRVRKHFGYWLYMATHDPRTREWHLALDSKVFGDDDAAAMGHVNRTLAEFNCRCTKIPVGEKEVGIYGLWTIRNGVPEQITDPPLSDTADDDAERAA